MAFGCVLALALAFTAQDATNAYNQAKDFVADCTPRAAGTIRGQLAANWILDRVSMQGADIRIDKFHAKTPKGTKQFANLMCGFCRDANEPWTFLISHFDSKDTCPGANDGASTTGILMALAEKFLKSPPSGNVMLAWLDGEENMISYSEEDGFWGSKHLAAQLNEQGWNVRAVVCLDMLGDKDLNIMIPSNSDSRLIKIVMHAVRRAGLPSTLVQRIEETVKDDHVPFLDAGFPAIDLIDFDYGSARGRNDYWHTSADTMDKLSIESFHLSGRLVTELLNILMARASSAKVPRSDEGGTK